MKCNKDLQLILKKARYYFTFLDWDTRFFGIDSFILDEGKSKLVPSEEMRDLLVRSLKKTFVTARVDSHVDALVLDFLQSLGFKYVDTEVTLRYDRRHVPEAIYAGLIAVKKMKINAGLPYKEFGSSFTLTRFHSDPCIRREKADLLWVEYLKNYTPSADKHMFVAEVKGTPAGVMVVNEDTRKRQAVLFFVAVRKRFQGKGVGSWLIQQVIREFGAGDLLVGTQTRNIRALNFYIKNGFTRIDKTRIVLHRWSK